jgi:hypothetical protein
MELGQKKAFRRGRIGGRGEIISLVAVGGGVEVSGFACS